MRDTAAAGGRKQREQRRKHGPRPEAANNQGKTGKRREAPRRPAMAKVITEMIW